jgi:hypothetical protein
MNIGDRVKLEDTFSETLYGVIINKEVPRCKCKGKGEFTVDFNGDIKKIKIDDKRLTLE